MVTSDVMFRCGAVLLAALRDTPLKHSGPGKLKTLLTNLNQRLLASKKDESQWDCPR